MTTDEIKPLHPLEFGTILLVGVKASNLPEEIRTHPRVIMWESQNEHWSDKDLPTNTRAVFITRWIGHNAFHVIMKQARKRRITVFNQEGTGLLTRHVKELLSIGPKMEDTPKVPEVTETKTKEPEVTQTVNGGRREPKLHVLNEFIDFTKSNAENGRALLVKASEMGITSTFGSLAQHVAVQRKRQGAPPSPAWQQYTPGRWKDKTEPKSAPKTAPLQSDGVDVSVQILDDMIKGLKDMREFLIATTKENTALKAKVAKFRKFFDE